MPHEASKPCGAPQSRDPWVWFSARCAVLYFAACAGQPLDAQMKAAQAAYDALPAPGVDEGMTLALSERHLRDAFYLVTVLGLYHTETRVVLWAAIRLFAVMRAARRENTGHAERSRPEYWWQDRDNG